MQAWIKDSSGFQLVERPEPRPTARQIVIAVRAVSLNYRDLVIADAAHAAADGSPARYVPCSDGAGEVVAVGTEVTRFKVGDRVAATFFLDWVDGPPPRDLYAGSRGQPRVDGMLARLVATDEAAAVRVPAELSDEEAACLPCAGVTAWNSLIETGGLRQGQRVLLLGSGGVSLFALQFAKAAGARVIFAGGADHKLERARALGADVAINYKTHSDWVARVRAASGGYGVDHVVEVGGAQTIAASIEALAPGGHLSVIGLRTGIGNTPFLPLILKGLRAIGVLVGTRGMFERMLASIVVNRIRPVIDRVEPFERADRAIEAFRSGAHFGKVVIR